MRTNSKNSAVAVFDSGVGGLTILKEVVNELPNENIIYFADIKNCPYGAKSKEEIITVSKEVVKQLTPLGVKMIIVACNTATTNAISSLRESFPEIIFIGTEPAVKPALVNTKSGVVGILATRSTLSSHKIDDIAKLYGAGKEVIEMAGDGLVELIEEDKEESEECIELLKKYINPMIDGGADYIALGCTHYPFLAERIKEIIGEREISIVEPALAIAGQAKRVLTKNELLATREEMGEIRFLSSSSDDTYNIRLKDKFSRWQQI